MLAGLDSKYPLHGLYPSKNMVGCGLLPVFNHHAQCDELGGQFFELEAASRVQPIVSNPKQDVSRPTPREIRYEFRGRP
jgi:hypothetical protein